MEKKLEEIKKLMGEEDLEFYKKLQKIKIQESASVEMCIICYTDQISIFAEPLECGHIFHTECIKKWVKYQKKCPYCKKKITNL